MKIATFAYTAFFAVSLVAGFPILPRGAPATYGNFLEPYNVYHARYMALGCEHQHGKPFFNECCHPLLKHQELSARPSICTPKSQGSQEKVASAPAPPPAPKPQPPPPPSNDHSGGVATYFYQNGVAGACGTVHKDTDYVAALDSAMYGNLGGKSQYCGRQLQITNKNNGHSVTVTVADACPTCMNGNSVDLSVAAFKQLSDLATGEFPIAWHFV